MGHSDIYDIQRTDLHLGQFREPKECMYVCVCIQKNSPCHEMTCRDSHTYAQAHVAPRRTSSQCRIHRAADASELSRGAAPASTNCNIHPTT